MKTQFVKRSLLADQEPKKEMQVDFDQVDTVMDVHEELLN